MIVNDSTFSFKVFVSHVVVAIVAADALDGVDAALRDGGIDTTDARVLSGDTGVALLDADGTAHGFFGRLTRHLQTLTAAQNERLNLAAALKDGKDVILVPASSYDEALAIAQILENQGGERIFGHGHFTMEQLS